MPSFQNPNIISSGTILSAPASGKPATMGNGNMPVSSIPAMQPPSMFMQPTYLSPAMPMNSGIDLYGGMAQPFTPFVNGMPMQPTTPATTPSASDHPCQGNGGSGCSCGGSCTGKCSTNEIVTEQNQTITSSKPIIETLLTPIGQSFLKNDFQIKLDPTRQKIDITPKEILPALGSPDGSPPKIKEFGKFIQSGLHPIL